ncbi:RidA family protein [Weeksella virosa]|uniref:Endoribonuclease L-PSP n=1 Tax=Weeksella virosa (strain ATCC 43766 / DSM 16922 / JCM 21250 / CCUG 30538 / CDC 9751 / IAM 14551 / NBRC 16016 / NCTC 11634 / CL345/78) TaxID=865938 RepID=F0NYF0_WEEVC|nr:RidA family protein [Weeksella virosa]ADX68147.1 endoribonuclease L-PSP [Weeksella virosa DSM 16922]MDK7675488.1 RidA family protein [Weeksella virosa]SUP54458.1 Enamine/imine deaminase [Weeksella virosa]VEH64218.1 Enamine/imine deaminase [Weeksella virosa]
MRKVIHTENAPKAIGPYSQAIVCNGLIFVSGQVPVNPETGEVVSSSFADEVHQVMKNVNAILAQAGTSINNVVKVTIFLSDMNNFAELNELYAGYFSSDQYPARECVQVARLPRDVNVEISVIAQCETKS